MKKYKILFRILISITIILYIANIFTLCYAIDLPKDNNNLLVNDVKLPIEKILGIMEFICYAATIIVLIMIGAKWVGASPEGKADIKNTSIQYVIAAIVIFSAGTIFAIIKSVTSSTIKGSQTTL